MEREDREKFFSSLMLIKKSIPTVFAVENINFTESMALVNISKNQPAPNFHQGLFINKSAVSQMLTNLEKKGYIVRCSNEIDRRKNDVKLTDLGEKIVEEMEENRYKMADEIFETFTEEKAMIMIGLFEEFSKIVEQKAKERTNGK